MTDHNPFLAPKTDFKPRGGEYLDDDLDYILAGRGTRLLARIVDNLLTTAAALPGLFMLFAIASQGEGGDRNSADLALYGAAAVAIIGVLLLNIYQWYLISTTGQSLAKKWLSIRIVKVDQTPVDFVSGVLLREWVLGFIVALISAFIPGLGNILSLANAVMIFGKKRRCLHDLIASTRVVVAGYE